MSKRPRRFHSEEFKRQVVEEFTSGRKSAAEVAGEIGVAQGVIYKWRTQISEADKGLRVEELEEQGHSKIDARRIIQLETEVLLYKEKLAEMTVREDLLKKLHGPLYPALKNANGLDEIKRILDQSKRRVK